MGKITVKFLAWGYPCQLVRLLKYDSLLFENKNTT